ncbi:hypothetical protein BS78_05G006300 [Paspalum vaginatum]|nr:hypothetical protein BS78_05G006300 [Paspalum vaginatum]
MEARNSTPIQDLREMWQEDRQGWPCRHLPARRKVRQQCRRSWDPHPPVLVLPSICKCRGRGSSAGRNACPGDGAKDVAGAAAAYFSGSGAPAPVSTRGFQECKTDLIAIKRRNNRGKTTCRLQDHTPDGSPIPKVVLSARHGCKGSVTEFFKQDQPSSHMNAFSFKR